MDGRRKKRKTKPWDYQKDKSTTRYKRDRPRAEPHADRYAEVRGTVRSHYRSDGHPKRAFPRQDLAENMVTAMNAEGKLAKCYRCPLCGSWHIAHEYSGGTKPAVLDEGGET